MRMEVRAVIRSLVIDFRKGLRYLQAFKIFCIPCLNYTQQIKWENEKVKCSCWLFFSELLKSSQFYLFLYLSPVSRVFWFNLVKFSSNLILSIPFNVCYRKYSGLDYSVCTLSSELFLSVFFFHSCFDVAGSSPVGRRKKSTGDSDICPDLSAYNSVTSAAVSLSVCWKNILSNLAVSQSLLLILRFQHMATNH